MKWSSVDRSCLLMSEKSGETERQRQRKRDRQVWFTCLFDLLKTADEKQRYVAVVFSADIEK